MRRLLMLVVVSICSGCATYPASLYSHSLSNIQVMKAKNQAKPVSLKVDEFSASKSIPSEIMCRGAGPVVPSPGKTYEKYIRDAFYDELVLAGVYEENAPIILEGLLESLDFSSGISGAEWDIGLTVKSSNGHSITVFEKFQFGSSFDGDSACRNTANAFAPAVQSLLTKVVTHPEFEKMLASP